MIRVLHVIDSFDLGGAQTALLAFLRFTDRSRFQCDVASMHGHGIFWESFTQAADHVYVLSPKKWLPLYVPALYRLIKKESYDIVHFHLFGANWIGKPVAALAGAKVRFNHDQCNDALRDHFLYREIDRLTNRLSTRILAVSKSTQKFLIESERLSPSLVEWFPNSVDTQWFVLPDDSQRQAARKQFHCDPHTLVVLAIGRLHPQKNFRLFLEMAAQFRERKDIQFLLAGTGPEEEALRAYAQQLGIENRVQFLGFIQDTRSLYAAADVLMMTSLYEGLPMVLLEAMASGCVPISVCVDGIKEVVDDEIHGLLVANATASALKEKLAMLLQNPDLLARLAHAAREHIVSHFDSRIITRRLENLYQSALEDCQRRE